MSNVLSLPHYVRIRFGTSHRVVEKAIYLFSADPVIDEILLPEAHLLWEHTGYTLRVPNRANERIAQLLQRYSVPFSLVVEATHHHA